MTPTARPKAPARNRTAPAGVLAGILIGLASLLGLTAPASAAPGPYPAGGTPTLAAAGTADDPAPVVETDDGFEPSEVVDWAKDNVVFIIPAVGLLLLVMLWRHINRPKRMTL